MRPAEPPAKTLKTTTHLSQGRRGRLSVVAREGRGQGRETGQQDSRSIMAARDGRECRWAGDHANHTFFMSSQLGSSSSRLSLHEPCLQPKKDRRQEYDVSFFRYVPQVVVGLGPVLIQHPTHALPRNPLQQMGMVAEGLTACQTSTPVGTRLLVSFSGAEPRNVLANSGWRE